MISILQSCGRFCILHLLKETCLPQRLLRLLHRLNCPELTGLLSGAGFLVADCHSEVHAAAVCENFLKDRAKLLLIAAGDDCVLEYQMAHSILPECNIRMPKEIAQALVVLIQLIENRCPVSLHQIPGIVLLRQTELFDDLRLHPAVGADLLIDALFNPPDVLLVNQTVCFDIDLQCGVLRVDRDPRHGQVRVQLRQFLISRADAWKCLFKRLRQPLYLLYPSFPAPVSPFPSVRLPLLHRQKNCVIRPQSSQ